MNKTLRAAFLMLIVFALVSTASAKVVTESEALKVATNFLLTQVKQVWNSTQLSTPSVATLSTTSDSPTFYVFAPESGKGFVIVSADDSTQPVLGYSDSELLVGDDMPCCFRWWCETMDKQIVQLREMGAEPFADTYEGNIATLAADELLLETALWDQGDPYNQQCPQDGYSRCQSGCVPTSFAVAMRYHNHPECGAGTTSAYNTKSRGLYVASRDLSSHVYDWDNMLMQYGSSFTTAQATAVATLEADIGAVFQSDYTTGDTNTDISNQTVATYLNQYFDYSSSVSFIRSISYTNDDWTALMKRELQNSGPLPYGSSLMAHQFVLDGYNASDYFHINWGWSGYNNGYFLLPNIVSGNDTQYTFLNFIPDDGLQTTTLQVYGTGLSTSMVTFAPNVTFQMGATRCANMGAAYFNGSIAYGLTDSEGNLKELISDSASLTNFDPNKVAQISATNCVITGSIYLGDCIRLCYKNNSTDEWRCMEPFENIPYKIVITSVPEGIESIPADNTSTDDAIYTMQGIRLSQPNQKGVYIKNGKKILVK